MLQKGKVQRRNGLGEIAYRKIGSVPWVSGAAELMNFFGCGGATRDCSAATLVKKAGTGVLSALHCIERDRIVVLIGRCQHSCPAVSFWPTEDPAQATRGSRRVRGIGGEHWSLCPDPIVCRPRQLAFAGVTQWPNMGKVECYPMNYLVYYSRQ